MSTHETHERDRALVEAALFLAPQPLTRRGLAKILEGVPLAYIDRMLEELKAEYAHPIHGIELHTEDGRAMLRVKAEHVNAVAHLAPQQDVPRPVLRTLAVIAYNHPMTQADAVRVRGNKAYAHIKELLERGLVRAEDHGRTLLLHVTKEFLRHFGLNSVEEFRFHFSAAPEEVEMDPEEEPTSGEESVEGIAPDGTADTEAEGAPLDVEETSSPPISSSHATDDLEAEGQDDPEVEDAADRAPDEDVSDEEAVDDDELRKAMTGNDDSGIADQEPEAEDELSGLEAAEEEEDG